MNKAGWCLCGVLIGVVLTFIALSLGDVAKPDINKMLSHKVACVEGFQVEILSVNADTSKADTNPIYNSDGSQRKCQ